MYLGKFACARLYDMFAVSVVLLVITFKNLRTTAHSKGSVVTLIS